MEKDKAFIWPLQQLGPNPKGLQCGVNYPVCLFTCGVHTSVCVYTVSVRICVVSMQEIVCTSLYVCQYLHGSIECVLLCESGSKSLPFNRDFNVCKMSRDGASERGREREQTLCDDVIVPVE